MSYWRHTRMKSIKNLFNRTDPKHLQMFRDYLQTSYKLAFDRNKKIKYPFDVDLVSYIAIKYLEKAIPNYNISKKASFTTYLYNWIRNGFSNETKLCKTKNKYLHIQSGDRVYRNEWDDVMKNHGYAPLDYIIDKSFDIELSFKDGVDLIKGINNQLTGMGLKVFKLMVHSSQTDGVWDIEKIRQRLNVDRSNVYYHIKKIQNVTKQVQYRLEEGLPV